MQMLPVFLILLKRAQQISLPFGEGLFCVYARFEPFRHGTA